MPLHKAGNINKVENYRGITLLCVLGKLFTSVINARLTSWAEKYNVYIETQSGFRSGYSTIDNVFLLKNIVDRYINTGNKLYCCFIDFRKAFDYVTRLGLWYKLLRLGIRGNIIDIIRSMYTDVLSSVRDPHSFNISDNFECPIGVRQGECVSPFLFAMYINDLEDNLHLYGKCGVTVYALKLYMLLYDDDAMLFADSIVELQNALNQLSIYCNKWKLILNTDKTKIIVLKKGGKVNENYSFFI